jgi:hypothetical protein
MPDLAPALEKAKAEMMKSSQIAMAAGQWERAEWAVQSAKSLDSMLTVALNGSSGAAALALVSTTSIKPKSRPAKLPHFYTEADKLVKVGASRDGGTYEHRVIRAHYDLMIDKLVEVAGRDKSFETPDLIKKCDVPKHEPLIIVAMLESRGLLIKFRRGRWVFKSADTFATDVQKIWVALPHH